MIKVGLIGFGKLGKIHAQSVDVSDIGELVAVCDTSEDALTEASKSYKVETYSDVPSFLENDMDAVIVASITPLHLEHVMLSAKSGKAVFTEKPIGLTLEETDKALQTVVDSGVKFQIGFQRRWDSDFHEMKRVIDSGEIGKPVLFKAYGRDPNASHPSKWGLDKNGGLFLNAAIHDFDAARFILDAEVEAVNANGTTLVHHGLNEVNDVDTSNTVLFMKNGTMAITEWSRYATYGYDVAAEVICEKGRIEVGSARKKGVTLHRSNDDADSVYTVFKGAYQNEIEAFLKSVKNDENTSPGVEDARIALQIALAARRSHETQSKVTVHMLNKLG